MDHNLLLLLPAVFVIVLLSGLVAAVVTAVVPRVPRITSPTRRHPALLLPGLGWAGLGWAAEMRRKSEYFQLGWVKSNSQTTGRHSCQLFFSITDSRQKPIKSKQVNQAVQAFH